MRKEVASALELSVAAGWNQTEQDWSLLLDVAPDTCFGITVEDRLVATASLACYGLRLGWVGMVLTHPDFRSRGFATRLVTHCLEQADALGIRTVKLDATEQGQPLYEKLGFVSEQPVERWLCPKSNAEAIADNVASSFELPNEDVMAFGADRSTLLTRLANVGEYFASRAGYQFRFGAVRFLSGTLRRQRSRVCTATLAFGPCAASWRLGMRFVTQQPRGRGACERGFTPQRHLTRMSRGENLASDTGRIYGVAGFEFG